MTDTWTVQHTDHTSHRTTSTAARSWADADRQIAACTCDRAHRVCRNGRQA